MIVRLTGTLLDMTGEAVIVERDGVAREILVPQFAIPELAAHRGLEVTLHTIEFLEGNQASGQLTPRMLGFLRPEDRDFFTRFVGVKGIGARKALKALGEPVRRIATWIESGDAKALARLPGIGPRAADLIIASLKGKMDDLAVAGAADSDKLQITLTQAQCDAREVLIAWGDPRGDVERLLERTAQLHPDLHSADDWVRAAYRIKAGVEG